MMAPTSNLIRQILGAVSEFDKAMTIAKLKGARDRIRRAQGKCESPEDLGRVNLIRHTYAREGADGQAGVCRVVTG
jgi:hypothetical protein